MSGFFIGRIIMDEQALADSQACLKAALEYLSMGWSVLSLCPHNHVGIDRVVKGHHKTCESPGKRPWHTWSEFQTTLPTEADVRHWWKTVPNCNVGIALGPVSGLIRVDVEGESGEKALADLANGDLPDTLEFRSGRAEGGRGLLYGIPEGVTLKTTYEKPKPGEEVRFQAKGAQTVLPPSRHPKSKLLYEWTVGKGPKDMKVTPAPAWLLKKLEAKAGGEQQRDPGDWEAIFAGSPQGGRNDNMTAIIGKLFGALADIRRNGDVQAIWYSAQAINERNDPPLAEAELKNIFVSVHKAEKRKREAEEDGGFSAITAEQIRQSVESPPIIVNPESNGKHHPDPPKKEEKPWHLIIVESEPEEYKLRSPLWSDSKQIKDGYIILTASQIMTWNSGGEGNIRRQAFRQARKVLKTKMQDWNTPGGHLDKLLDGADYEEAAPESKRQLLILGFVYRYLASAPPSRADDEGKLMFSRYGKPAKMEDGSIIFKLPNLKKEVKEAKEDFAHREITRLLEERGFAQKRIGGARWWVATKEIFDAIGKDTGEGE